MAITMEQVRAALDPEEPDYVEAAKLGAGALAHLKELINGTDVGLAAKAASLTGMIAFERAADVLADAAKHQDPRVRVAAAAAARDLDSAGATKVLLPLFGDADIGVQKTALRAASVVASDELRAAIADLTTTHEDPAMVQLANTALRMIDAGGVAEGTAPSTGEMPSGTMKPGAAGLSEMPDGGMDQAPSGMGIGQEMPTGRM